MKIRVPKEQEDAFLSFLTMHADARHALLEQLRRSACGLPSDELAAAVASALGRDKQEVADIIKVLVALHATVVGVEKRVDEFVDAVLTAGRALLADKPSQVPVDWKSAREHLSEALTMEEPLGLAAKALQLPFEHSRVFYEARILTDIRAVFGKDPSARPSAAMILHNLRISYSEDDQQKSLYFALDSEDIKSLLKELQRALDKQSALKGVLSAAGLRCLVQEVRAQ